MAINSNARAELNYEWVARYGDGTELRQYDNEKDIEYTFGDVDQSKLVEFSVVKNDGTKSLSVDLKQGLFSIDGEVTPMIDRDGIMTKLGQKLSETDSVKPIYFRRVVRMLNVMENTELANIYHFIGWHGEVDGKYEKHELGISNRTDELIMPPRESFRML